ncbi:HAD family hydrolase [Candidatus Woesearchaeota archaeon]|nr:HAD family hydrolase [Candidatus Woesearchaeota archaeon]
MLLSGNNRVFVSPYLKESRNINRYVFSQTMIVVFDFDGTIVDSKRLAYAAFLSTLKKYRISAVGEKEWLKLYEDNFFEVIAKKGFKGRKLFALFAEVKKEYGKHLFNLRFFPGMKSLLKQFVPHIITSNLSGIVNEFFQKRGIMCVVSGKDKGKSKTKKLLAIKRLHSLDRIIFVGDTIGDIVEGKAAKVITVGVTWGWHGNRIRIAKPDYIVRNAEQLKRVLLSTTNIY